MKKIYQTYHDAELLQCISENDEGAFSEIYRRYAAQMFITAFNILRRRAGAEDAVQDIFITLWKRRSGLQIDSLKAYLRQAVRYRALRMYKDEKKDDSFYARLAQATSDILQDDPVIFRNIQQLLQKIILTLPRDQQLIYRLHREQRLTYAEIAKRLDISVKTVEKKMSKSLKSIRPQLDKLLFLILAFTAGF
ncbi:MAG: sigma-70 family RNA polymerase sigma factor [Chitinophagaceae bacterium]|nr:sigma-70 family RNA polymerase sigma factor [Chitinophagaceae bacterium]